MKRIGNNDRIEVRLEHCPTDPGVYLMKDGGGRVIYVGKAKNLRSRVRSYFQKTAGLSPKTQHLVANVEDIEFLRAGSETEALLLENNLIKKWKPKYNVSLRDDKTYPYLRLDLTHPFPRPYVARKQNRSDGSEYFGPFPYGGGLREALRVASKVFLLRDCRDTDFANRSRPCLSHQIGQCTAPCVALVSPDDYAKQVAEYRSFLKGDSDALEKSWEAQMEEAAEKMEFERAARLRDRLASIRAVHQEQRIVDTSDGTDKDVWAYWPPLDALGDVFELQVLQFRKGMWVGRSHKAVDLADRLETEDFLATLLLQYYTRVEPPAMVLLPEGPFPELQAFGEALRSLADLETAPAVHRQSEKGEWARLGELALENVKGLHADEEAMRARSSDALTAIAKLVELDTPPRRLECVDISNMQGEANVASAVVFLDGKPAKHEYRHYKILGFDGQDDFASMREVLSRRFGKPDSPRPDLLVIDGGKGQLAAALAVLKELKADFPVVGLAKARTKRDFASGDLEGSEERLFLPGQKNAKPIRHAEAFRVLTYLRDEAHRFAITFHREKRSKARGLS